MKFKSMAKRSLRMLMVRPVRILFFISLMLIGAYCFGEEAEVVGGHAEGIPRIVMYEALNFFALMLLLFFVLKKRVTAHFEKRHLHLTAAIREAKRAKQEADKSHQEYLVKIKKLEGEAGEMLAQLRKEAEESKQRILTEAQRLAQAIELEAKKTAANEVEKAKAELYDDVLQQALDGARGMLSKAVADNDQRRLQKEFTDKIEAVQ